MVSDALAAGLVQFGAYGVGVRDAVFTDPRRNDREVSVTVRYPAIAPKGGIEVDADPDPTGTPYPTVMGSEGAALIVGPHLASHGFVVVGVHDQESWPEYAAAQNVDYPIDFSAALDGLEALGSEDPLSGLARTRNVGFIDYSFGAWTALMLAGARVNPAFFNQSCTSPPTEWSSTQEGFVCGAPAPAVRTTYERSVALS